MPPTLMENGHGAVSESIHDLIFKEPPLKLIINLLISCPRLPLVASGASSRLRSDFFPVFLKGPFNLVMKIKNKMLGVALWEIPRSQCERPPRSGKICCLALNFTILYHFPAVTLCIDQKIFRIRVLMLLSSAPNESTNKAGWISVF